MSKSKVAFVHTAQEQQAVFSAVERAMQLADWDRDS